MINHLHIYESHDQEMSKESKIHAHIFIDVYINKKITSRNSDIMENKHHKNDGQGDECM